MAPADVASPPDAANDAPIAPDAAPDVPTTPSDPYRAAVLADGPVAYWRFEERAGTQAADEVGNAHPGRYFGGVTLGAEGVRGAAVRLDGTSGCVAVGEVFRFAGRVPFSVEGWVRLTEYGREGTRIASTEGFPTGVRSGWNLSASYGDTGFPYFDAWNSDSMNNQWTMGAYASVSRDRGTLPLNEWAHVVGTYEDTREEVWVNGVRRDRQNQTGLPIPMRQGVLSLGCASDGMGRIYLGIHGALDEVAIYDRVLTEAQITGHYEARR